MHATPSVPNVFSCRFCRRFSDIVIQQSCAGFGPHPCAICTKAIPYKSKRCAGAVSIHGSTPSPLFTLSSSIAGWFQNDFHTILSEMANPLRPQQPSKVPVFARHWFREVERCAQCIANKISQGQKRPVSQFYADCD